MASDPDLSAWFESHRPCSMLGMRVLLDEARGDRLFPTAPKHRRPVLFLDDPGPMAHGWNGCLPGDAFFCVGGEPAHYEHFFPKSPAELLAAFAVNCIPGCPVKCCFLAGQARQDRIQTGTTLCHSIPVGAAAYGELSAMRDTLSGFARSQGRALREPNRHFSEPSYFQHLLKRDRFLRKISDPDLILIIGYPVHVQYLWVLGQRAMHAGVEVRLTIEEEKVSIEPEQKGDGAAATGIRAYMAFLEHGPVRALWRELERAGAGKSRYPHMNALKLRMEGERRARLMP